MKEENIIQELFDKTELSYPIAGMEEAVLKKIAIKNVYKKKQQVFNWIGKIGVLTAICLCFFFTLTIGEADMFYLFLGAPFILLLLMFPLETIFKQTIKQ